MIRLWPLLLLLFSLPVGADESEGTEWKWQTRIRDSLKIKVSLDVLDRPLRTVLNELALAAKTNIVLDHSVLSKAQLADVTDAFKPRPLKSALERLLGSRKLTFAARLGCIVVSSKAGLKAYPVSAPRPPVAKDMAWRRRWGNMRLSNMALSYTNSSLSKVVAHFAKETEFSYVLAPNTDGWPKVDIQIKGALTLDAAYLVSVLCQGRLVYKPTAVHIVPAPRAADFESILATLQSRVQIPSPSEAAKVEGHLARFKGTDAAARKKATAALIALGNKALLHLLELQYTAKGDLKKRVREVLMRIYKGG